MLLSEFSYHLPEELIAQEPLPDRSASRMLVLDRQRQRWEDRYFRQLPEFLRPGDCLALNNSKVFPSRLFGHRAGVHSLPVGKRNPRRAEYLSGPVEVFLLHPAGEEDRVWSALVRPGRKMAVGERVLFGEGVEAEILARGEFGERTLRFHLQGSVWDALERLGHMPLPPYIKREDRPGDRERYQTVYAEKNGSVAAPTAGLHFTPEMLAACHAAGADIARVTLHVGLGTFQPLHTEVVEEATLHHEFFEVSVDAAAALRAARRRVAVGTTAVRALESAAQSGTLTAASGQTNLFLYPGYSFRAVDALLTNFHLPASSLLLLVAAFAGQDLVMAAYEHAVRQQYRFFSYGDCMLIL